MHLAIKTFTNFLTCSNAHFKGHILDPRLMGRTSTRHWWNRELTPERQTALHIMRIVMTTQYKYRYVYAGILRVCFRNPVMRRLAPLFYLGGDAAVICQHLSYLTDQGEKLNTGAYRSCLQLQDFCDTIMDLFEHLVPLAEQATHGVPSRMECYQALRKCRHIGPMIAMLASGDMVFYGLVDSSNISLPLSKGLGMGAKKGLERLGVPMNQLVKFHKLVLQAMLEVSKRMQWP
ncbi:uncharacterized protein SPPG_03430 [Spizellomyces punctatus DAOM BR117]|uniref:Uncharacterized protein n=1 Tax=Spizellomyces punctatus (strain DAOM BR117) TaxID=645134 RepID=A0A0L0HLF4_SPIPD|nr:uncharacterized protein SPPG_03430 [Spizellomyces punctatus DAOM BR117]KND01634.1 hypothetical protein SPPG_03430 [Spizellomyces punctatus DAOM BR117]|eukprot:XP_016609673.1 hypothetical protein SPPG_03430 [Spizellomyces punctatus DAOM BR117]